MLEIAIAEYSETADLTWTCDWNRDWNRDWDHYWAFWGSWAKNSLETRIPLGQDSSA